MACAGQSALALQRVDLTNQAARSRTLIEADRLKTAILHAVSHDLRTPITIIKTSAANLDELHDRLLPEEQRELARVIETQADELDRLVGNLLDLSRLQAGAVVLNAEWNSLEEIAGEVAAHAFAAHQNERIALDFPDDLPLVRCDYGLMLQALGNLVENSLRHQPPGKLVIIHGRALADVVRLEVVNHGPIIAAEERERIMEPFYQSRDGQSQKGGVGLGLAIARGIVEAHHGHLTIEDTPGGGATFVLTLPRQVAAVESIHGAGL
jgi:two-component system sensor histidine kinase KdpD